MTIEDVTRDCMDSSESNGLIGSIAAQIRSQLMAGGTSVENAARSLGTSVRTLQRGLKREGTDFRTLTNAVRGSRAIELLRGSDAAITEVSTQLGYSASTHFARAVAPTALALATSAAPSAATSGFQFGCWAT